MVATAGAVAIREMRAEDSAAIAELSVQLGYPATPGEIEERWAHLAALPDHAIFVACLADQVVGWIDLGMVQHLQSPAYCEIGGLVVSERHRSRGIGRQLVREAQKWAAARSLRTILVRSRVEREGAHAFYLQNGFSRVKTSAVFTKPLAAP